MSAKFRGWDGSTAEFETSKEACDHARTYLRDWMEEGDTIQSYPCGSSRVGFVVVSQGEDTDAICYVEIA
jgi:hypothetical protein